MRALPRRVITPALLATLILAPALAGCLEPRPGERDTLGPALEVTLEPEEATLGPDETITLTAKLWVREETAITHRGCPPEPVDVFVRWGGKDQVRLYAYGDEPMMGACVIRNVTLEKGVHAFPVQWNGHTQPAPPDPHDGPRVGAAAYTVVARLAAKDRDVPPAEATVTVTG